jgi:hypothetical protein
MTDSKAALMHAVLQKKMGTAMVPILKQFWFQSGLEPETRFHPNTLTPSMQARPA